LLTVLAVGGKCRHRSGHVKSVFIPSVLFSAVRLTRVINTWYHISDPHLYGGGKTVVSLCYFCDLPKEEEWQYLSFPVEGHVFVSEVHEVTDTSDKRQSVYADR